MDSVIRALPRPLSLPPWTWLIGAALVPVWVIVNVSLVQPFIVYPGGDWHLILRAVDEMERGQPYADALYIYPPLATWVFGLLVPLGYPAIFAAHFAALALLRPWWLIVPALASAPFWIDALLGNFLTFAVVAGVLALRGSRAAGIVYLASFLLIPRIPLLPLAVWLIWRRPDLRLPAVVLVVAAVAGNLAIGHVPEWIGAALSFSGDPAFRQQWDVGPTRFLGAAWLLVGIPLGVMLAWWGRLGWAGLAVAPYVPPPLLLLLLWEAAPKRS